MKKRSFVALLVLVAANVCFAQRQEALDLEMMTHAELHSAIHEHGKTTVLVYNGGTEQRGPHCILGGHTLMARKKVEAIAARLGNALAAPVLPFSPTTVDSNLPGGISLPVDVYVKVNEAIVDSMVQNGFKNVVLMADHGRGQQELKDLADQLDRKYAAQGAHVYFCGDVYAKANTDFDEWLKKNGYPTGGHASISDTSEMLYLGGSSWVRKDKIALGDPVPVPGQQPDPKAPRLNNGVTGDPRRSSRELGKRIFDLRVTYAVEQIKSLIAATR